MSQLDDTWDEEALASLVEVEERLASGKPAAATPPKSAVGRQTNRWKCRTCTAENTGFSSTCFACARPKGTSQPSFKQAPISAFSSRPQGSSSAIKSAVKLPAPPRPKPTSGAASSTVPPRAEAKPASTTVSEYATTAVEFLKHGRRGRPVDPKARKVSEMFSASGRNRSESPERAHSPTSSRSVDNASPVSSVDDARSMGAAGGGFQNASGLPRSYDLAKPDVQACSTWIYPVNFPIRAYQLNIVKQALFTNTLVALPTGLGKTFIAAVVMYNFYRWFPDGIIVFSAPTRPLVSQQVEACHKIMGIPESDTAVLQGTTHRSIRAQLWQERRVFYCTPQCISNDMDKGLIPAHRIVCFVVDEAHRAKKRYAYVEAIRKIRELHNNFRVLALSATPGGDIHAVQEVISNLGVSHIEVRLEDDLDVKPFRFEKIIEMIKVKFQPQLQKLRKDFIECMRPYVNMLAERQVVTDRRPEKLKQFMMIQMRDNWRRTTAQEMPPQMQETTEGLFRLVVALVCAREALDIHGTGTFMNSLLKIEADGARDPAKRAILNNSKWSTVMGRLRSLNMHGKELRHPKLSKLEDILVDHFRRAEGAGKSTRAIVFTSFRGSVYEVVELLDQYRPLLQAACFVGQSTKSSGSSSPQPDDAVSGDESPTSTRVPRGQTQKQQQEVVRKFRCGEVNVLVATCVGEEGLDIGSVDLIISYDALASPVRMIQRMGRTGRKRAGRCVMLIQEGVEEYKVTRMGKSHRMVMRALRNNTSGFTMYNESPRMLPEGVDPEMVQKELDIKSWRASQVAGVAKGRKKKEANPAASKGEGRLGSMKGVKRGSKKAKEKEKQAKFARFMEGDSDDDLGSLGDSASDGVSEEADASDFAGALVPSGKSALQGALESQKPQGVLGYIPSRRLNSLAAASSPEDPAPAVPAPKADSPPARPKASLVSKNARRRWGDDGSDSESEALSPQQQPAPTSAAVSDKPAMLRGPQPAKGPVPRRPPKTITLIDDEADVDDEADDESDAIVKLPESPHPKHVTDPPTPRRGPSPSSPRSSLPSAPIARAADTPAQAPSHEHPEETSKLPSARKVIEIDFTRVLNDDSDDDSDEYRPGDQERKISSNEVPGTVQPIVPPRSAFHVQQRIEVCMGGIVQAATVLCVDDNDVIVRVLSDGSIATFRASVPSSEPSGSGYSSVAQPKTSAVAEQKSSAADPYKEKILQDQTPDRRRSSDSEVSPDRRNRGSDGTSPDRQESENGLPKIPKRVRELLLQGKLKQVRKYYLGNRNQFWKRKTELPPEDEKRALDEKWLSKRMKTAIEWFGAYIREHVEGAPTKAVSAQPTAIEQRKDSEVSDTAPPAPAKPGPAAALAGDSAGSVLEPGRNSDSEPRKRRKLPVPSSELSKEQAEASSQKADEALQPQAEAAARSAATNVSPSKQTPPSASTPGKGASATGFGGDDDDDAFELPWDRPPAHKVDHLQEMMPLLLSPSQRKQALHRHALPQPAASASPKHSSQPKALPRDVSTTATSATSPPQRDVAAASTLYISPPQSSPSVIRLPEAAGAGASANAPQVKASGSVRSPTSSWVQSKAPPSAVAAPPPPSPSPHHSGSAVHTPDTKAHRRESSAPSAGSSKDSPQLLSDSSRLSAANRTFDSDTGATIPFDTPNDRNMSVSTPSRFSLGEGSRTARSDDNAPLGTAVAAAAAAAASTASRKPSDTEEGATNLGQVERVESVNTGASAASHPGRLLDMVSPPSRSPKPSAKKKKPNTKTHSGGGNAPSTVEKYKKQLMSSFDEAAAHSDEDFDDGPPPQLPGGKKGKRQAQAVQKKDAASKRQRVGLQSYFDNHAELSGSEEDDDNEEADDDDDNLNDTDLSGFIVDGSQGSTNTQSDQGSTAGSATKEPQSLYFKHMLASQQGFGSRLKSTRMPFVANLLNGLRQDKREAELALLDDSIACTPVHDGYRCDGCGEEPILALRYSCPVCNLDLCEECAIGPVASQHHREWPGHDFVVISTPEKPSQQGFSGTPGSSPVRSSRKRLMKLGKKKAAKGTPTPTPTPAERRLSSSSLSRDEKQQRRASGGRAEDEDDDIVVLDEDDDDDGGVEEQQEGGGSELKETRNPSASRQPSVAPSHTSSRERGGSQGGHGGSSFKPSSAKHQAAIEVPAKSADDLWGDRTGEEEEELDIPEKLPLGKKKEAPSSALASEIMQSARISRKQSPRPRDGHGSDDDLNLSPMSSGSSEGEEEASETGASAGQRPSLARPPQALLPTAAAPSPRRTTPAQGPENAGSPANSAVALSRAEKNRLEAIQRRQRILEQRRKLMERAQSMNSSAAPTTQHGAPPPSPSPFIPLPTGNGPVLDI